MVFDPSTVEAVQNAFPEWMAYVFAVLSYLGSVWFVAPVVVLAYWLVDRHRFAPWLGIVMGGYAVMVGLKGYFDVPRPGVGPAISPAELPPVLARLYAPSVEVGTTSFPSGHAIAGTIVWTMLALETDVGSRRTRLFVAGVMIVLVGFSRIGVGVHYPIDVVVGTAVALAYLAVVLSIERGLHSSQNGNTATKGVFATVAVIALGSLLVGGRPDAAALLGSVLGSLSVWHYAPPPRSGWVVTGRTLGIIGFGLAVLAVTASVLLVVESYLGWFLVGLCGGSVVMALPLADENVPQPTKKKSSPH